MAKMPSRSASIFAQPVCGLDATLAEILAETQSGVVESRILPSAANYSPRQAAGAGLWSDWSRAVAA